MIRFLFSGAKQANLREDYIAKLSETSTYQPSEWIKKMRLETRVDPSKLATLTVEDVAKHKDQGDVWIGCLGYVVNLKNGWSFPSHRGRDVTTRVLMQYHGIPMDDNDDGGRPPYPIIKDFTEGELEYVSRWLDHFQFRAMKNESETEKRAEIVGFLKEFNDQQIQGKTDFVLPKVPQ